MNRESKAYWLIHQIDSDISKSPVRIAVGLFGFYVIPDHEIFMDFNQNPSHGMAMGQSLLLGTCRHCLDVHSPTCYS